MNKKADEQKKPMNRNSAAQKSHTVFRKAGFLDFGTWLRD